MGNTKQHYERKIERTNNAATKRNVPKVCTKHPARKNEDSYILTCYKHLAKKS
jgi:hypothetical protein